MRIGVDVDGVLADFNRAYIPRIISVTGINNFPLDGSGAVLDVWNYPKKYGYTNKQISTVWDSIRADSTFWLSLEEFPTTGHDLYYLTQQMTEGHDVYFITARVGPTAKRQTEQWLESRLGAPATVLISNEKGLMAAGLELDAYIDDKWENVVDVHQQYGGTATFLMRRPWNAKLHRERSIEHLDISSTTEVSGIVERTLQRRQHVR